MKSRSKKIMSLSVVFAIVLSLFTFSSGIAEAASATVQYRSHCQNIGWTGYSSNGATSGTEGRGLRMEAIQIRLKNVSGSIRYKTHCQNVGWTGWSQNGATSGTEGRSLRMEAIRIELTGTAASLYDIEYRTHCQNVGWTGWSKNGATSGTEGKGLRMEAIQIRLKPKSNLSNNNNNNNQTQSNSDKYYSKLTNMKNGSTYNGTYRENIRYTGPYASEQCKGFAKSVFEKLFGYNIGSTGDKGHGLNYKINISTSRTAVVGSVSCLTESNAKSLFAKARPGDFVQMRRKHTGSHSAIVYSVSSSGVTFYESNLDGANGIVVRTYTWRALANDNASMSVYTAKNR